MMCIELPSKAEVSTPPIIFTISFYLDYINYSTPSKAILHTNQKNYCNLILRHSFAFL